MSNEDKILEMLTSLTETVSKLSEGQTEMRSDIADLKATQTEQGKALAAVQAAQVEMQATQAKQGEQLTRLENDVSELKADVKVLDERSLKSAVLLETDVARDTRLLYEGHSGLKRQLATLATKEQVEDLSSDVEVIKSVVTRHSGDINKLKRAQ